MPVNIVDSQQMIKHLIVHDVSPLGKWIHPARIRPCAVGRLPLRVRADALHVMRVLRHEKVAPAETCHPHRQAPRDPVRQVKVVAAFLQQVDDYFAQNVARLEKSGREQELINLEMNIETIKVLKRSASIPQ